MWGYRLQDVGTNCSEMLLFQALLNCPCSQGALLFLMKQHFLGFDIWTKAFWASLLSKCVCSKDGHGSCHPIYLMFVFASAVILEVSYTCATFSVLSLLLLHDLEMQSRPWPPVMHTGGLAFELDSSTNGINSCFSQRTDSLWTRSAYMAICCLVSLCPPSLFSFCPFWKPVLLCLERWIWWCAAVCWAFSQSPS